MPTSSEEAFQPNPAAKTTWLSVVVLLGIFATAAAYGIYTKFRIDVPSKHFAVLVRKTGQDITNDLEQAPGDKHKGVQHTLLSEGRYFYNPYYWDWNVYPMIEVTEGMMGVRVRLYGDDLPYGHFVATQENQKGIVAEVLRPGRYAINAMQSANPDVRPIGDFTEIIELHEPITIPAGYKGIVTNLAGPMPEDPNSLLVDAGRRGVQEAALDPGTYYMNPYTHRISAIDCRSQRFNLAENYDMGFPSKDGFWVSLDGIIEFRVKPNEAAEVFVMYNEKNNDASGENRIGDEIIQKVIMPNARAFCRLRGSNSSGVQFISGKTRSAFQAEFQEAIRETCDKQGIEIVQALITKIHPPQAIAEPVRQREVARQELRQYQQEKFQQDAEAKLAIEKALIGQKEALVVAQQAVVKTVTKANELQQVAVLKAEEHLEVSRRDLDAAKDRASAVLARARAQAGIIEFANRAEAAGWKRAVDALDGDGEAYARFVLYQKLAPGYRTIMANTADSPLMDILSSVAARPSRDSPSPDSPSPDSPSPAAGELTDSAPIIEFDEDTNLPKTDE